MDPLERPTESEAKARRIAILHRPWRARNIVIVIMAVFVVIWVSSYWSQANPTSFINQLRSTTCTVADQGSSAKIVVYGPTAQDSCNLEVSNNGFAWSDGTSANGEQLICQVSWDQDRWTVYDEGIFDVVGHQLCNELRRRAG